ncbi:MAG: ATP-binding protein [candidate division KSB1 bacterium]|nr:ATP-binding protein [candidate division KSB1 bacterium]MDZ7296218.1 ATP-binding protein [candidate division KSB1 bacterium]MDZ7384844.1 ATP-binding protein [candidate division KSB1 bacterium]MDZ7392650.1 ATP-binding protein [candidate division KSB1 bacterium]MDZ7413771.1 ATP-binding protein [candidate division KSB1 bacterium]
MGGQQKGNGRSVATGPSAQTDGSVRPAAAVGGELALGAALADFSQAMASITSAHQELSRRIAELDLQLAQRNAELAQSLLETQRLKTYLNYILDSMSNCLVVVDRAGTITLFNKAAERLTGYQAKEVVGRRYEDVFRSCTTDAFAPLHVVSSASGVSEGDKEIVGKSGQRIPIKFACSRLTDPSGQVLGAIEVFSDLSTVRLLEEQRRRISVLSALTEMAGVVAHEIRNPLQGIAGYAALLSEELPIDDPRHGMARQILEGVQRLDEIVNNLLLLVRPGKGFLTGLDLTAFLREFVASCRRRFGSHSSILVEEDMPTRSLFAKADPVLLERALWSIVHNAVQAMPEGGKLRVALRRAAGSGQRQGACQITIADTGLGMSREVMDRLFMPFFTTKERGAGLGLAIARNLIAFQQGEIMVRSSEGNGTCVTVTLPCVRGVHE